MRYLIGRILIVALLVFSVPANAVYNANMNGRVVVVATYMDGDYIYFQLSNQPTSHPQCNPAYFVITASIPENRRNQAFAQLLAAKQTLEPVNIGYDALGDCADGYIRVHRVG